MNYSLFNTVVMFDHNSPPNLVPRAWTRLLHYLRAMLTNAVWKRFSRWTWGTLPSAAFSRILNASQVKVTWPSQKSTEYFESRAHSTRNASILKVFETRLTSSGFSTDEGLRVIQVCTDGKIGRNPLNCVRLSSAAEFNLMDLIRFGSIGYLSSHIQQARVE